MSVVLAIKPKKLTIYRKKFKICASIGNEYFVTKFFKIMGREGLLTLTVVVVIVVVEVKKKSCK